jgi:hypothetical protein
LSCALCSLRKEKRFCPAVHGRICPQCCGEQREVTLDCPSECPYLQQAREHEKPRDPSEVRREQLFPDVEVTDRFLQEHEHLILGFTFALAKSARADRSLADRDLISSLTAITQSYQTLVKSSLIYDPPTASLAQQAIAAEIDTMVKEFRQTEEKHRGFSQLRDSDVLKTLVFLVYLAHQRTSGRPKSRAFVDFLFAQFPEKPSGIAAPEEAGSRIVIP